MPNNKNQHYVPRCYLKPFTLGAYGHAINLVHIRSSRAIPNAPVKGQCAKDYIYGRDLQLEELLKSFEGRYASVLKKIQDNVGLTEPDLFELKVFAWLQYSRTESAFTRLSHAKQALHEAAHKGLEVSTEQLNLSEQDAMLSSMRLFTRTLDNLEDLAVCIVLNETSIDFITSDDPAILTNRFHMQKLQKDSSGIGSSGALLVLPLTPRHILICHDSDIYKLPQQSNFTKPEN